MSELAFNLNGEPFEVPPTMAAWRVRKLKPKGAPEVVYGRDGLPLFLPMDADIEDLRREAPAPADGRYRLDPVDDHNRAIPDAQSSYVCVHAIPRDREIARDREPEPAAPTTSAAAIHADTTAQLVHALLESQKQHTELARMYVAQFPVLVNALSGVVRSAGDAGLPARVPLVVPVTPEVKSAEPASDAARNEEDDEGGDQEEEEDDDDEDGDEETDVMEAAPESAWNWPRFAATALDKFGPAIESLVGQLPALGATLGARRAKRAASEATDATSGAPTTDIATHLNAILAALSEQDAAAAMALASELSMADKLAYFQKLRRMSVSEAVAYVRGELAKLSRNTAHGAAGPGSDEGAAPSVAISDAEIDAHIGAIRAAMTPEESETVQVMFEELVLEHRLIWVEKLCRMSVPEGVAFLRKKLAEARRDARARGAVEPRIVRTPSTAPSGAVPEAAPARPDARHPSAPAKPRRDGRRVAGSPAPSESSPTNSTAPTGGAPTAGLVIASPTTQAHIDAIQRALTPEEDAAVRAYLAALPQAERSAWIASLLQLPVHEAVAMIRAQHVAGRAAAASPSDTTAPSSSEAPNLRPAAAGTASVSAAENPAASAAETAPVSAVQTAPLGAPKADLLGIAEVVPVGVVPPAPRNLAAPISRMPPASTDVAGPHDVLTVPACAQDTSVLAARAVPGAASPAAASSPDAVASAAPRTAESNADTHLLTIEHALTAGERFLVHAMVVQMSPDQRELLLDKLLSASVAEGAAILRGAIEELTSQARPVAAQTETIPIACDQAPDERRRIDDAQTFDDPEALDVEELAVEELAVEELGDASAAEELGDASELEIEELDEQPDDEQTDHAKLALEGPKPADGATHGSTAAPTPPAVPSPDLPTLSPEAFPHFKAIESALTLAERLRVFELGAQLSAAQLRAWVAELSALPAPQAVAKVRTALAAADARPAKKGGVS